MLRRIYEPRAYGDAPITQSFWRASVEEIPDHAPLNEDRHVEIAVIGAGYTGLNAALALAEAGREVLVLEAEQPGWGASGRNGGFCCVGAGGLSAGDLMRRFGAEAARDYTHAERAAVDHVAELLERHGIKSDTHSQGETQLAHRPRDVASLRAEAEEIKAQYGVAPEFIAGEDLAARGFASPEFHAALTLPIGFALNPMKYALGLARAAHAAGVTIHGKTPVLSHRAEGEGHLLSTPQGRVRAKTVIFASNGYSSEDLPPWLAGRFLPVQSSILVTRELSDDEIAAQGWSSSQMCYDTRKLLHYFRLMPNRRLLFGLRGARRCDASGEAQTATRARADLARIFPAWAEVETPYSWSGLVCIARDLLPFAGPVPGMQNAYAALAYQGNGVAMASYAGRLLAAQITGQGPATPAPLLAGLKRFELGRYRRALLPLVNAWYGFRDGT